MAKTKDERVKFACYLIAVVLTGLLTAWGWGDAAVRDGQDLVLVQARAEALIEQGLLRQAADLLRPFLDPQVDGTPEIFPRRLSFLMADVHYRSSQYPDALQWAKLSHQSLNQAEADEDTVRHWQDLALLMAQIYEAQEQPESALSILAAALAIRPPVRRPQDLVRELALQAKRAQLLKVTCRSDQFQQADGQLAKLAKRLHAGFGQREISLKDFDRGVSIYAQYLAADGRPREAIQQWHDLRLAAFSQPQLSPSDRRQRAQVWSEIARLWGKVKKQQQPDDELTRAKSNQLDALMAASEDEDLEFQRLQRALASTVGQGIPESTALASAQSGLRVADLERRMLELDPTLPASSFDRFHQALQLYRHAITSLESMDAQPVAVTALGAAAISIQQIVAVRRYELAKPERREAAAAALVELSDELRSHLQATLVRTDPRILEATIARISSRRLLAEALQEYSLTDAMQELEKALDICRHEGLLTNPPEIVGEVAISLADAYFKLGDEVRALELLNRPQLQPALDNYPDIRRHALAIRRRKSARNAVTLLTAFQQSSNSDVLNEAQAALERARQESPEVPLLPTRQHLQAMIHFHRFSLDPSSQRHLQEAKRIWRGLSANTSEAQPGSPTTRESLLDDKAQSMVQRARYLYYLSVLRFKDWKRRFDDWRLQRQRRLTRTTAPYEERLTKYQEMANAYNDDLKVYNDDPSNKTSQRHQQLTAQRNALKQYHDTLTQDREALLATMNAGRLQRELGQMLNEARVLAAKAVNQLESPSLEDHDEILRLKYLAHCQHAQTLFALLVWDKRQSQKELQLQKNESELLDQLEKAVVIAEKRMDRDNPPLARKATEAVNELLSELKQFEAASEHARADDLLQRVDAVRNETTLK